MILPGATIGVVGGGQLGRMLALEARRMGYRVVVLDPAEDPPAAQVADGHIRAQLDDAGAASELARRCEVVTLEWENADVGLLRSLEREVPVRPGPHVLEVAQHRVREKEAVRRLGLETAEFRPVGSRAELDAALRELGAPAILKTARGGYDAKGQRSIASPEEARGAFDAIAGERPDLILEKRVDFALEASVICARSTTGEIASFPIGENVHERGILDVTVVPASLDAEVLERARAVGEAIVEGLDVVGVLAVELFVTADGHVLVNEIAPRPHNSGHYTWEACSVSQFEQQLRAVCGLPLERPVLLRPAAMANLLGEHLGGLDDPGAVGSALSLPATALHLYGKAERRTGRKMGHLTSLADDAGTARRHALEARQRLAGAADPRNREDAPAV